MSFSQCVKTGIAEFSMLRANQTALPHVLQASGMQLDLPYAPSPQYDRYNALATDLLGCLASANFEPQCNMINRNVAAMA